MSEETTMLIQEEDRKNKKPVIHNTSSLINMQRVAASTSARLLHNKHDGILPRVQDVPAV